MFKLWLKNCGDLKKTISLSLTPKGSAMYELMLQKLEKMYFFKPEIRNETIQYRTKVIDIA